MTREEVKEIILSHSPCKVYEDSTLESLTKAQLIELLKVAEHNWAVELAGNDQLKENVKDWEPVRHAHWELVRFPYGDLISWELYKCSACGREECRDVNEPGIDKLYPYCNCGCKMDEVVEDE